MKNSVKVGRARLDLTQEELAQKVEVSRQTIYAIETQKYEPSVVLALKIADVFGERVDDIFELEEGDWETQAGGGE